MPVVATGMHLAGVCRDVVEGVFFVHIERIEIGPQTDSAVRIPDRQRADHPCLSKALMCVDPERL